MANSKKRPPRLKLPFVYSLNNRIRNLAMRTMGSFKGRITEERADLSRERIEKILLVRATFRMGSSILATPAIFGFRSNFPSARIDIVGSPLSGSLLKNLPIDHCFSITRRFPHSSWAYLVLLKQIRSVGYDLAVDVSCSQSAMGSFIVGLSGARFRAGVEGKWDHGYNIRVPKPAEINKYRVLPAFLAALGLRTETGFPRLILSPGEREEGKAKLKSLIESNHGHVVGVFVGGRSRKGKGWPMAKFRQLIDGLDRHGVGVVVFFGPEEKKLMGPFGQTLGKNIPLIFEPSARSFAALVSNCAVFITWDSGPMHMACALGVRTIAIFPKSKPGRWGPPAEIAKTVGHRASVEDILELALAELSPGVIAAGSPSSA